MTKWLLLLQYILGLADLTGELMRNAINALGAGNLDACFALLGILQSMAEGFGQLPKQVDIFYRHQSPSVAALYYDISSPSKSNQLLGTPDCGDASTSF